MQKSRVLVIEGVFIGAVLSLPENAGWRIVAADPRLASLNGIVCASHREAERLARQAVLGRPSTGIAA